jgi:actin-related protein 8
MVDLPIHKPSQFPDKLAAVTASLKERMRFFKLRATPNATVISETFNKQFQPEVIPELNDASRVEWIDSTSTEDVLIGDNVCIISRRLSMLNINIE